MSKSSEVKKIFIDWFRIIDNNNERYYIAKSIDFFYALPATHHRGLLEFIVEQMPNERWQKLLKENLYLDVIRSILFYYSGREDMGQPTRKNFRSFLGLYLRSKNFKDAETNEGAVKFTELLEEIA